MKYCVECGSDDVKATQVDMIMMEEYVDHDIDSDPIIVLPCGHFYGIESLDGHFELHKAYEKSVTTGEYVTTKSLFRSGISDRPMKCPECRAPISLVRRYGRVLNFKSLQVLERKHMVYLRNTMVELSRRETKDVKTLLKLRKEIETSPMRLVQDACRSLQSAESVEIPGTSSSLFLQWLKMTARVCSDKATDVNSPHYSMAIGFFLEGIDVATATKSWWSCALFRIAYVKFLWRFMSSSDSKSVLWTHLDWVISMMPDAEEDHMKKQIAIARHLKEQIANSVNLREVVAAMDGGYSGNNGASGHWYECTNGHPYYIGECGRAMQTSFCIECGEEIGGSSHRLLGSNQAWRGLEN